MIDLQLAAQIGIMGALNVPAMTGLSPVWQHVPDNADPPLTIIGNMNSTPIGGKGGGLDLIEFEILTLVREAGREFLTPLMTMARSLIEDQQLTAEGATLSRPVFESADDELLGDGNTYLGTQRFSLVAQPA